MILVAGMCAALGSILGDDLTDFLFPGSDLIADHPDDEVLEFASRAEIFKGKILISGYRMPISNTLVNQAVEAYQAMRINDPDDRSCELGMGFIYVFPDSPIAPRSISYGLSSMLFVRAGMDPLAAIRAKNERIKSAITQVSKLLLLLVGFTSLALIGLSVRNCRFLIDTLLPSCRADEAIADLEERRVVWITRHSERRADLLVVIHSWSVIGFEVMLVARRLADAAFGSAEWLLKRLAILADLAAELVRKVRPLMLPVGGATALKHASAIQDAVVSGFQALRSWFGY
jgi:hypothetical protein